MLCVAREGVEACFVILFLLRFSVLDILNFALLLLSFSGVVE